MPGPKIDTTKQRPNLRVTERAKTRERSEKSMTPLLNLQYLLAFIRAKGMAKINVISVPDVACSMFQP